MNLALVDQSLKSPMVKVERDKHVSTVEIARELGIDHKTVLNNLHKAGYKKKLDFFFLVPFSLGSSRVELS